MMKLTTILLGASLLLAAAPLAAEKEWSIESYNIAAGGVVLSDDGNNPPQWQLSGTIGQWEATEARASSGGGWDLTGGFWGLTLEELSDRLFGDRFENDEA